MTLPTHAEYYKRLDKEQLRALDRAYDELGAATGMRRLWEHLNRTNKKQRLSQQHAKAGKETGETKDRPASFHATQGAKYHYKVRPWISWREVQAYVAAQQ